MDALTLEHAPPGLAKHPVQQRKRLPELCSERLQLDRARSVDELENSRGVIANGLGHLNEVPIAAASILALPGVSIS